MALIPLGEPGARTIAPALPWILTGLLLRAWSFAHLGGQGRTRDPSPPEARVVTGPYAVFEHPVYVANLLVAAGLTIAIHPSGLVAAGALVAVTALYTALAARESGQVEGLPVRRSAPLWDRVPRWERSTWLTIVGLVAIASF